MKTTIKELKELKELHKILCKYEGNASTHFFNDEQILEIQKEFKNTTIEGLDNFAYMKTFDEKNLNKSAITFFGTPALLNEKQKEECEKQELAEYERLKLKLNK